MNPFFSNSISSRSRYLDPELTNVVLQLRLKDYVANFRELEITYSDLPNLTEEELEKIIPKLVPRNRLKKFIIENFIQKKKGEGWEIDRELVTLCESVVEEGTYGVVKTGEVKVGGTTITVACKEIIVDGIDVQTENIINEVRMMAMCHHPNVLKCFGCFFSEERKVATICTAYIPEGDLLNFANNRKLTPLQKLTYLLEISKGLSYLHEKDIVHRDIKPANILIAGKSIKICDFGAAKISKRVRQTVLGTPAYLPPELYHGRQIELPKKLDVYAFGILMWELLCDEMPYYELQRKYHSDPYSFLAALHGKKCVKKGKNKRYKKPLRPNIYHENLKKVSEMEELLHLIESCWDEEPENRPCFVEVVDELENIHKEMKKSPKKYHDGKEDNQLGELLSNRYDDLEEEGEGDWDDYSGDDDDGRSYSDDERPVYKDGDQLIHHYFGNI